MKNTFLLTPLADLSRAEFTVVGDKRFQTIRCLVLLRNEPMLQGGSGVTFGMKRKRPDEAGVVVNYIHQVGAPGMGW